MVSIKKKLFVFGGFYDSSLSYKYYYEVWMFNMETYKWEEINYYWNSNTSTEKYWLYGGYRWKMFNWRCIFKTKVKKEIDRGTTHSDMFCLAPNSKCFVSDDMSSDL